MIATTRTMLIQTLIITLCLTIEAFPVAQWSKSRRWGSALNMERRDFLETSSASLLCIGGAPTDDEAPPLPADPPADPPAENIRVPLTWIPSLNAYVLYFTLFDRPEPFGAVLDTGSPFLTVPSTCDSKWGCYRNALTKDSGLSNTVEHFDNNEGTVVWRKARFSFLGASGSRMGPRDLVFGVLEPRLMGGSGGVFFGLIKKVDSWIRPSFLSQLDVKAFSIDLESEKKSVTLSTQPMLESANDDYIPLVSDLHDKYGFPVLHYSAVADSIIVNDAPLTVSNKPTYVIFDTGVTGLVVNQELFDQRYNEARQNHEKSLWGSVQIMFRTASGKQVLLEATKPVATPLGPNPRSTCFKNINVLVVGLAFLDGRTMAVDIDDQKLKID